MAISFVGQAGAATTSVTLPAHNVGDLILIFAYRTNTTAPTIPAGYNAIPNATASANSNSFVVGYKVATGSDTSGTWSTAGHVNAVIYRGVGGVAAANNITNAASTTTNVPTVPMANTSGTSWIVGFAASKQTTSQSTPASQTLRGTQTGTTQMSIAFDTNAGVASWSATTSTAGSAVTGSGTAIELLPASGNITSSAAAAVGFTTGPTTVTWTHYNAASNPLLVLEVGIWQDVAGTGTVTAATYNGVALTFITSALSTSMRSEIWYLKAPAAGANTISITVTGAIDAVKVGAATFDGYDQSAPLDTSNTATGASGNPAASITTGVANALVVSTLARFGTTAAVTNKTAIYNDSITSTLGAASYQLATTTGSYTDTYTGTVVNDWSMVIASFKPVAAAAAPIGKEFGSSSTPLVQVFTAVRRGSTY